MKIIDVKNFPDGFISNIDILSKPKGNPGTRNRKYYRNIITAFDIETTRLSEIEQSIMYIWQWCFYPHFVVIGRTWEELKNLINKIVYELNGTSLCIFVHNLYYEFQFLRAIYDFKIDEVFAVDRRRVLKCTMHDKQLEFRCTYLHSNMSLAEYTKKMDVLHKKLDGEEFNYSITRFPWTKLSEKEIEYCVNDVLGLCEAIEKEMQLDDDNLYTFPLTSTGYVRRDVKREMKKYNYKIIYDIQPNIELYNILGEAFRGGDTHANRYYTGRIIENVKSFDRKSSYPDVLCNCKFPMSKFRKSDANDIETLKYLIIKRQRAVVMRVKLYNIRLRYETWGDPYLTRDKSRKIINGSFDNGRILSADYLETTITDIDFRIILETYKFDNLEAYDVYYTRYDKLPVPLIDCVKKYFRLKTELKGNKEQKIYYEKLKAKLNAIYGMMAQRPVKQSIIFDDGEWLEGWEDESEILARNTKKAFLAYQWGVWCTAHARRELYNAIKIIYKSEASAGFVYCDTDSVKYWGDVDFSWLNEKLRKRSKDNGAYAIDSSGVVQYMGEFECDAVYKKFKTLGAKKYAFVEDGEEKTNVTIAGVTKKKGGDELDKCGGLDAFRPGFVFREAGGTEAVYNDNPEIGELVIEGHKINITPNIVLRDSTYTLGITAEYENILQKCGIGVDKWISK